MSNVIALDEYRRKQRELTRPPAEPPRRPQFRSGDVWGRNYTELESVVFGLLKVRETLRYYTEYESELEELLLDVLDAAYRIEETGFPRLKAAILPLKEYILDNLGEEALQPMKTSLIILDLIEKSPLYR